MVKGKTRKIMGLLSAIGLTFGLVGCSGSPGTITGNVTYNGKPVKGGTVTFMSTSDQPSSSSEISAEGTYKVEGVAQGEVVILVETESINPRSAQNMDAGGGRTYGPPKDQKLPEGYETGGSGMNPKEMKARYVKIPDKYAARGTSGLKYTVESGKQTYNIELK